MTVPNANSRDFLSSELSLVEDLSPTPSRISRKNISSSTALGESSDSEPIAVAEGRTAALAELSRVPTDEADDLEEFKKRKAWSVTDGRNI